MTVSSRKGPGFIWQMVRQDFVNRFAGEKLGLAWLLIWPAVQITVFTLVFAALIGPRLPGASEMHAYGVYLVAGILPWTAFAQTIARMTTALVDQRGVLTRVPVPLSIAAGHIAISETLTLLATLALFLLFHLLFLGPLTPAILAIPVLIACQQMMAVVIGLASACATVFVRDMKDIVATGLFLWFWLTPIVYLPEVLPAPLAAAQSFNPSFWFIAGWQDVFVRGQWPDWGVLGLATALSAGCLWLLMRGLRRWERDLRDFL